MSCPGISLSNRRGDKPYPPPHRAAGGKHSEKRTEPQAPEAPGRKGAVSGCRERISRRRDDGGCFRTRGQGLKKDNIGRWKEEREDVGCQGEEKTRTKEEMARLLLAGLIN